LNITLGASTVSLEISSRNARVQARQNRWDRLRAGPRSDPDQRCADMADLPGGASGSLVRDYKGKEADRLVYGVDTASSLNCALPRRFGPLYDKPTYPANLCLFSGGVEFARF
jgi:hypothetical protein